MTAAPPPECYYQRLPGSADRQRFRPTRHTGGAWQPGEQHMAPVSGIIVHALQTYLADRGAAGLTLCRLSFEILGMIAAADVTVAIEVVRPGRTIELVEATLVIGERAVVRARGWLLARHDTTAVAGGEPDPLPFPDGLPAWAAGGTWTGGYIDSLRTRVLPGQAPGRTRAWIATTIDLVDEPSSDLARFVGLVDTANGIAVRQPPRVWMFPNVDLSIHLYRSPVAGWVGLDTTVVFGRDGVGLTSSTLHDRHGPVGRAEQILTVRPVPVA